MSKALKSSFYFLLFLAISLTCANSVRILDEVDQQLPIIADTLLPFNPAATSIPPKVSDDDNSDSPLPVPEFPVTVAVPPTADDDDSNDLAPVPTPIATSTQLLPTSTSTSATVANPGPHSAPLCFFMHHILDGTNPSARVVTGIITSTEINGIPFSKSNNNLFPINGGNNNAVNGNNNNQPFVSAGQLPPGSSLQKLMFGAITVIENELTEGHELGSGVVGRAQGFYLASFLDRTSQTVALTALLHNGNEHEHDHDHDHIVDSISFFGVHRTASPHSHIVVVVGTEKY
ncbi:hypothetical protein Ddye_032353 [Dipteronia dyeriana]|uniref:Dirigent protein n=1 Tax=Dipteronia dyeriana TaxID=168575 RepID=A0AAD9WNG2_9ROSI|nr:hypothetical protein Ddye_032353 [Dipteronia dyeriana]